MSQKRNTIDPSIKLEAVKRVKIAKESKKSVARDLNIPKSNLLRYIQRVDAEIQNIETASDENILEVLERGAKIGVKATFTPTQEKVLMSYILKCSDLYYGLSVTEVRRLAFESANKIGISIPQGWKKNSMAGHDWFYAFMKRNPSMSLRTPQQVSFNRVRGFSRGNVDGFFVIYSRLTDEHHFEPHMIWNIDETGFCTVPTTIGRVLSRKGAKQVGTISSAERGTLVSMAIAVSAGGGVIPPFYVFPRKNMRSLFLDHATKGAVGVANRSGWMKQAEFLSFMQHFIKFTKPTIETPALLLLDNHTSHLSIEAIDLANDNGVIMLTFPPHCSHRLQPLNVSVFGPLKTFYKSQCSCWMKDNVGRTLEIQHIPGIVDKCLDLALTPGNIKAGFRATGISPFNCDIFTEADFIAAELSDENISQEEDNVPHDDQRIVVFHDRPVAEEEVVTSEPSTSTASLSLTVQSVEPLRYKGPKPKSNRGRKAMENSISTSLERSEELRSLLEKRKAKETKSSSPLKKVLKRKRSASPQKK